MKTRKPRILQILMPGLLAAALLGGCASTPADDASEDTGVAAEGAAPATDAQPAGEATDAQPAEAEDVKVVQNAAQAEKYLTEEQLRAAKRECMRKMRQVTGSRIPRNACQGSAGLFSQGYNQQQENNSPRGTFP